MVIRIEIITPAQRAELEAILRTYEHELEPDRIEPQDYFRRKPEAMFRDPDRWVWWAADESGERVGFAIFRKFREWPDDSKWVGSIAEFTIFPAHRRKGYGMALARMILQTLEQAECRKVELAVLWGRESALGFWKSVGFAPTFVLMECCQRILGAPSG